MTVILHTANADPRTTDCERTGTFNTFMFLNPAIINAVVGHFHFLIHL